MNREGVSDFYRSALAYVSASRPEELSWVRGITPETFDKLDFPTFLAEYCWVVYAAGFRVSVVEKLFERLRAAYCDFDPDRLCTMTALQAVFEVNANKNKAVAFLRGARKIQREGYDAFKERLKKYGMEVLGELPYIGPITQKHLARNIGLFDVAKDDIWLVRVARKFGAETVEELTRYLAAEFGERKGVIDLVLWRYCADNGLQVLDRMEGTDSQAEARLASRHLQEIRLTGRWFGKKGDVWDLLATLKAEGATVRGQIRFQLLECPRRLAWSDRIGDFGLEFVEGALDGSLEGALDGSHLTLRGYHVSDNVLLTPCDYVIDIHPDSTDFKGTTTGRADYCTGELRGKAERLR